VSTDHSVLASASPPLVHELEHHDSSVVVDDRVGELADLHPDPIVPVLLSP
jgi:hypothetical protein